MTAINQMIKELKEVIARKVASKENVDAYEICLRRAKELKENEADLIVADKTETLEDNEPKTLDIHGVSNRRELLIAYEIKMSSCSDEQAEIKVDSYLASISN